MRVRFNKDFDWRPRSGVVVAYKQQMELTVTRACAERAIAAGAAEEMPRGAKEVAKAKD